MRLLLLVLVPFLAAPARAEDPISLVARHRAWYCGKKDLSPKTVAVGPQGEMVLSSGNDLLTEFVQKVYNKLAVLKDTPAAFRILPEIRAWSEPRGKRARELEAACAKEAEALAQAVAALDGATEFARPAVKRWLDLEARAEKTEPGDLRTTLQGLAAAARAGGPDAVGRVRRWLLELEGLFARLRDADRWSALEMEWMVAQATLAEQGLRDTPEFAWRRGLEDLPGAEGLLVRRRDLAAIQRIVEDQLLADRTDSAEYGRPDTEDAARALSPAVRPAWRDLAQRLADSPQVLALLRQSLAAPYDQLFVEHQLYKYALLPAAKKQSWLPALADVLRRWAQLHPEADGEADRRGLLEVLHFRQGAVHTAHTADDRFHPRLVEGLEALAGDRSEARAEAHRVVHAILAGMNYGGTASIAESFEKSTADCFRDTEMGACLLANAGHDGVYPLMWRADGAGHLINAMRLDERIVTWDGYTRPGSRAAVFPRDFRGFRALHVTLWHRALDTWVEGQVLLVPQDRLVRTAIPYYGQKQETLQEWAD